MTAAQTTPTFFGLGIAPRLLEILHHERLHHPTPIQLKAIPVALDGQDVIGIAETGTGKTLAFGIPTIQRLAQLKGKRALILLPTRELALQVDEALHRIGSTIHLRTAAIIGGANMERQIRDLRSKPHIIIATPGRLNDHLERKTARLDDVAILILDEADRMLDMGFEPQIRRILSALPKGERQTMLFSATMPPAILGIASKYMRTPTRVEIARPGTAAKNVTQELFFVGKADKPRLLEKLLADYRGSVLVFSRTKHGAGKVARIVKNMGHTAAEIHSNKSLNQRKHALSGFKSGAFRVLVATDIAARGIDVQGIELVLNYDLPDNPEDYIHRIGRTGRAGMEGHAISFATLDERRDVRDIERLLRTSIKTSNLPELPAARFVDTKSSDARTDRPYRRNTGHRDTGRKFERRPRGGSRWGKR